MLAAMVAWFALAEKTTRGRVRIVSLNNKEKREMVLAFSDMSNINCGSWKLNSGASWHLVNDETF